MPRPLHCNVISVECFGSSLSRKMKKNRASCSRARDSRESHEEIKLFTQALKIGTWEILFCTFSIVRWLFSKQHISQECGIAISRKVVDKKCTRKSRKARSWHWSGGGKGGLKLPPPVPWIPASRPIPYGFPPLFYFYYKMLYNVAKFVSISPGLPPPWESRFLPPLLPPPVPLPPPCPPPHCSGRRSFSTTKHTFMVSLSDLSCIPKTKTVKLQPGLAKIPFVIVTYTFYRQLSQYRCLLAVYCDDLFTSCNNWKVLACLD